MRSTDTLSPHHLYPVCARAQPHLRGHKDKDLGDKKDMAKGTYRG